eukprot:5462814-Pleurochrysis_carterae.AAC.5
MHALLAVGRILRRGQRARLCPHKSVRHARLPVSSTSITRLRTTEAVAQRSVICDPTPECRFHHSCVGRYGQTGTGKTFTMEGMNDPPELRGIIPRAFHQARA